MDNLEPIIHLHPRVINAERKISEANVKNAFQNTLQKLRRWHQGEPPEWVGVGIDDKGRLLQYVANQDSPNSWFIWHCMAATDDVLIELELKPRPRGYKTRKRKRNR